MLLGRSSIQRLSIVGRGELDFWNAPELGPFQLGSVRHLTSLHVKTDWHADLLIPSSMQLHSLEIYAPILKLRTETFQGWAQHLEHLCFIFAEFGFDIRGFADDEVEMYGEKVSLDMQPEPVHKLLLLLKHLGKPAHYFRKVAEVVTITFVVQKGSRFDVDSNSSLRAYNGHEDQGTLACICGICWACLQRQSHDM